jgi:hypothetical protein
VKFPLFFETTRKVARIYEILTSSSFTSHLHSSLLSTNTLHQLDEPVLTNLSLFKLPGSSDLLDYRDYLKLQRPSLHLFEKVLFTLREEHLGHESLK